LWIPEVCGAADVLIADLDRLDGGFRVCEVALELGDPQARKVDGVWQREGPWGAYGLPSSIMIREIDQLVHRRSGVLATMIPQVFT
jgi:hypothetical protein